jgi:lipase
MLRSSSNEDAPVLPIALIHGLIGGFDDERLLSGFAPRRTITPDLLGYGLRADAGADRIDLAAQLAELERVLDLSDADRVHLVGHSVGGVIAMLFAASRPDRVASLVSVEGNFSLADAFWSSSFARLSPDEAERVLTEETADPAAWLHRANVRVDSYTLDLAARWLDFQPAATVQAMAASVVEVTGDGAYVETLRTVFARTPVHLLAGELSRNGWDVPEWAQTAAASFTVLPGGHLMMADRPELFAQTINGLIAAADA